MVSSQSIRIFLFFSKTPGIMKKIISLGFDEARAEARAAGLAEGEAQEKFATAKRMLALGKSLQDIMLITDLPMSKIQELQTEIKSA